MGRILTFINIIGNVNLRLAAAGVLLLVFGMVDVTVAATFKTVNDEVVIDAEQYTRLGGSIGGKWFFNTGNIRI